MSRKITSKRKFNRNARKSIRRAMKNGASFQYGNKNLTCYSWKSHSATAKSIQDKK